MASAASSARTALQGPDGPRAGELGPACDEPPVDRALRRAASCATAARPDTVGDHSQEATLPKTSAGLWAGLLQRARAATPAQADLRIGLASLLCAALLYGCALPPPGSPHPAPLERHGLGLTGAAVRPSVDTWWESFHDRQLDRLVRLGLADNPSLAQAQARVAAALAESEAAQSQRLPDVNGALSASYQRAPASYVVPPPYAAHTFWVGQGGAVLKWDLDLFGRQAAAVRSARALAQSARLDAADAQQLLAGAIVHTYIELYREHALADIAQRSEEQRAAIVNITRRRVAAGLDTQLELRQAQGQVPQARVLRQQADAAADLAVHQLASLAGQGALAYASIAPPTLGVAAALPVPADLPINLLARRPDVLAARAAVAAADAQRQSDRAAFYPTVNLQALAGVAAFGLGDLFRASAAGGGGGPAISLPLFDGGRLRAQYRGSVARLDAAIDRYNATVLRAVRQTADQLTQLRALAGELSDQQQTLEEDEAAYRLAAERYAAGLSGYLSVLNAETQVLAARQGVIDIQSARASTRVALLLAVGGSFDPARTPAGPRHASPSTTF